MMVSPILSWQIFKAPLRFRFKHASADRSMASSIIVRASSGDLVGYGEACPRPYVTGETEQSVVAFLERYAEYWSSSVSSLADLRNLIFGEQKTIDENPAAFCALEMSLLDLLSQQAKMPIEALLGLPLLTDDAQYSAIIGDSGVLKTRLQSKVFSAFRFTDFKIKLGQEVGRDTRRFGTLPNKARLRVDANNLYSSVNDCLEHLSALPRSIWAVEEPVQPGDVEGQRMIAQQAGVRIILDESLFNLNQLEAYQDKSRNWIANIRVSKSGGILRSVALARAAQDYEIDVILGAHVGETSLLSRAALSVAQGLKRPPLAREGAFGRILMTKDVAYPSLRFGMGGVLRMADWDFGRRSGFGLKMVDGA